MGNTMVNSTERDESIEAENQAVESQTRREKPRKFGFQHERHAMERDGASKEAESAREIGDRPELRRNAAERRTLGQSRRDGSLRDVAGLLPVPRAGAIGARGVR